MAKIADLIIGIGANIDDFKSEMEALKKSIDGVTENLKTAGKQIKSEFEQHAKKIGDIGDKLDTAGSAIGTTFGIAGAAVAGGLAVAAKSAMDFEAQLSSIKAVSGATGDEMSKLKDLATEMGAKTKYSSVEAAQGIEELIKAGVSVKDIMGGGLEGALSLAVAGELELADAAEIASTALNAFKKDGLSVTDAANILAGGANASATSVGELKYGLSSVSAVASAVGMSFKDTTTALSVFAQNGLKGSDAGTSLKTMLMNLQPQTKAQIGAFKELGLMTADGSSAFFDQEGHLKSLSEVAGLLQTSMSGMTDAQRLSTMETIFGSDAIRASNILFKEGADGVNNMWDSMSKVTAVDVAKERLNNTAGVIEQLKGSFETLSISIGTALLPLIKKLAEAVQGIVDWFNNLSDTTKTVIAITGVVVAGLLLLVAAVGGLMVVVGSLMTAWAAIAPVLTMVAGVISGPVLLAIGAVIAIVILLIAYWDEIKAATVAVWQYIWKFIGPYVQMIVTYFSSKFGEIKKFITDNWDLISKATSTVWNFIKGFIDVYLSELKLLFSVFLSALQVVWAVAWTAIKLVLETVWNGIKLVIDNVLTIIKGILKAGMQLITGDWKGAWTTIKETVKELLGNMIDYFKDMGSTFKDAGKGLIEMIAKGIKDGASRVMDAAKDLVKNVRDLLPFSPAKEGPLSDLDHLDFAGPISDSIISGTPVVQGLMSKMLALPDIGMSQKLFASQSKETPVIVYLDGREISRGTLPHMTREIRLQTGLTM